MYRSQDCKKTIALTIDFFIVKILAVNIPFCSVFKCIYIIKIVVRIICLIFSVTNVKFQIWIRRYPLNYVRVVKNYPPTFGGRVKGAGRKLVKYWSRKAEILIFPGVGEQPGMWVSKSYTHLTPEALLLRETYFEMPGVYSLIPLQPHYHCRTQLRFNFQLQFYPFTKITYSFFRNNPPKINSRLQFSCIQMCYRLCNSGSCNLDITYTE